MLRLSLPCQTTAGLSFTMTTELEGRALKWRALGVQYRFIFYFLFFISYFLFFIWILLVAADNSHFHSPIV